MTVDVHHDGGPVMERAVLLLRGMAYDHRLQILMLLLEQEQTSAAIAASLPADRTSIAHHLRFLRDSRLIHRRRDGRQTYYSLRSEAVARLVNEVLHCARSMADDRAVPMSRTTSEAAPQTGSPGGQLNA